MTRIPYDQAAKALCETALGSAGRLVVQREVRGEPQGVDIFFEPGPDAPDVPGLLGRMVERGCLLEVFHDPPGLERVRDCLCKQLVMHRERRAALGRATAERIVPLWIVSAGRPAGVLRRLPLRARRGWPDGVYTAGEALGWNLIVVSELPRVAETLLVRLMGAGETLRLAAAELRSLPPHSWEARVGMAAVRVLISSGLVPRDAGEEAMAMEFKETIDEWAQRLLDQGMEKGIAVVVRQFERKLARPLAGEERARVLERLELLGPERLADVVLDLDSMALAAWLADPSAR
jgi:hypothetical protein